MDDIDALRLPEEKRKYIVETLSPLLEHMVADTISAAPRDPVPFLLDWLEGKRIEQEEQGLSDADREALEQENQELQANVAKVATQMTEVATQMGQTVEEEEEEDEEDEEPPPDFFQAQPSSKARASVSAEAYGEWNTKKTFVPPVIAKSRAQKERLLKCLAKSFLFSSLENNDMQICIGAMNEVVAAAKERIINQNESGDFLFVIESGELNCIIKTDDGSEKIVKTCQQGDVFGELALLYNCPRAASVEAVGECILWQLDRDTFNHIVKTAAEKKRARYDRFLASVPLLTSMDAYERSQLADALQAESFEPATIIVNEGDPGNRFYIIEEGTAMAHKNGMEVMSFGPGDYFGELALIRNQPRAATVVCKTQVKALSLDGASFKRLLNVNALLERSAKYY